ncbi:uncharacterized protein [Rutidosis leptorrhynchoides]|uniref:uncharacterized protein n=1 Tax=Rutidosis leptorrhynchoides TaxID=125765 RepID=UPI003A993050
MGRKLDALLGRKFKTSKFKATLNLAVSRVTILKNQRQARIAVARSDIVQLLNLDHHEHALLRVDQVIKEQNMLDVYVMVDGYCHLLLQMVHLIEQQKECPDELKEAASSLLYAAPRCGEFPELQEIRAILTARYGKDFAYGAIELRNNCGVSTRMIQKLSPRQSGLEARMKILQEIASETGVVLKLESQFPVVTQDELVVEHKQNEQTNSEIENNLDDEFVEVMSFSGSKKGRKKYRDVEDAAQAAFESAAYAAEAARAAVELSRARSFDSDNHNPDSPNSRPRKVLDSKSKVPLRNLKKHESESESESESEGEQEVTNVEKNEKSMNNTKENEVVFDESENEIEEEEQTVVFLSSKELDFDPGNVEPFGEGSKKVQQLDFTKRPISVRTKRVYGR